MEYTKGKWEATLTSSGDWMVATDETLICREARHFNAHLIAAAPDMYEALKELSEYIRFNMGNARPVYEKAIKALARAEQIK